MRSVTSLVHDMLFRFHHLEVASFGWSGKAIALRAFVNAMT
uniref:Uncharacterized protein n=1 Tax=Vibrio splendidus TaxID=29497 RepID=A0A0H3ZND1_VIBSP|nr:hypothetical protein [Vibrio splendidus]